MKSVLIAILFIIFLSDVSIGQEIFYRDKQSGLNFGYKYSNGKYSEYSNYYVSLVVFGKFIIHAHSGKFTDLTYNLFINDAKIKGGGIGFLTKGNKLPFSSKVLLSYTSFDEHKSNLFLNIYSLTFSIYKNLSPEKPINIIPQLFVLYEISSTFEDSYGRFPINKNNEASLGFSINFGYITNTIVSPILGFSIYKNDSDTFISTNLSIVFSKFRKER